jgi:hypothetical protein
LFREEKKEEEKTSSIPLNIVANKLEDELSLIFIL